MPQDTTASTRRPPGGIVLVRPLGGLRWCPTSFASISAVGRLLRAPEFLLLDFGDSGWLVDPNGLVLELWLWLGR